MIDTMAKIRNKTKTKTKKYITRFSDFLVDLHANEDFWALGTSLRIRERLNKNVEKRKTEGA